MMKEKIVRINNEDDWITFVLDLQKDCEYALQDSFENFTVDFNTNPFYFREELLLVEFTKDAFPFAVAINPYSKETKLSVIGVYWFEDEIDYNFLKDVIIENQIKELNEEYLQKIEKTNDISLLDNLLVERKKLREILIKD